MGQNQSLDAERAVVDEVEASLNAQEEGAPKMGTKLYKYVPAGNTGSWELAAAHARPRFYDLNEDGSKQQDWFLEIDQGGVDARIDQDLGYVMDIKSRRVTFYAEGTIWALRFSDPEAYKAFATELNDCAFANQYGKVNDAENRAKELGDDYAGVFFSADIANKASEPMDVDADSDEKPPEDTDSLKSEQAKETEADDEDDTIHGIVIGAGENNYLMRGCHFDVLRNVEGGVADKGVTFTLTPPPAYSTPGMKTRGGRTPGGAGPSTPGFTPSRVLLADFETKMNLLTPENPEIMHRADIETGKIVSTWKFHKEGADIPIKEIVHEDKAGQLDGRTTFLGLDNNRLCKFDLRTAKGMVQESPLVSHIGGKDYAARTNFTCMATSGDGYVAIGSKDGKVRLYSSKTLTQAKTAIPGLGAPITAIDVTHDGKWVLATTDKYLMVVKTTYIDDKGRDACGFTSKMGSRGAVPHLLRLRPEDAARTGGKPFSKGKFTWITESGTHERWVVANCGNFSVIWNFTKVRMSGTDNLSYGGLPTFMDYIITAKDEDVVDAQFLHPKYAKQTMLDQAALVVATPHKVFNMGG